MSDQMFVSVKLALVDCCTVCQLRFVLLLFSLTGVCGLGVQPFYVSSSVCTVELASVNLFKQWSRFFRLTIV
jgi:hypothetical protein